MATFELLLEGFFFHILELLVSSKQLGFNAFALLLREDVEYSDLYYGSQIISHSSNASYNSSSRNCSPQMY